MKRPNTLLILMLNCLILLSTTHLTAQKTVLGIDKLQADHFQLLDGKRVGLITNATGVNSKLVATADLLHQAPNVDLVALYAPARTSVA